MRKVLNLSRISNPCGKNCEKRCVGCRATCEAWIAYEAEKQEEYKRKAEMNELRTSSPSYVRNVRAKVKRQKRGRKG